MRAFIDPINVSPGTADGTYQNVDLTSHIDAGDQGNVAIAVFQVVNTSATEYNFGVRPTGTAFDARAVIEDDGHAPYFCAVDGSDTVDIAIGNSAVEVYLVGYFVNSEAEGYSSPVDLTPSMTMDSTWRNLDISSHTTGTALVALLSVQKAGSGASTVSDRVAFRPNGSTDTAQEGHVMFPGDVRGVAIPVDGSEILNYRIGSDNAPTVHLMGVVVANATVFTNAVDATSTTGAGAWEDRDLSANVSAASNGIVAVALADNPTTASQIAFRADGSAFDNYADSKIVCSYYGLCAIANQTVELNASTAEPFLVYGYFEPHSSGPSISSAPTTIVRTGTGYTITGSGFGASQGTGSVTLESSGGGTVEAQTVTAWSDTSITFDAVPGALTVGATDLVLRVTADAGGDDTQTGVTLRHPRVTANITDLGDTALANETGISWWARENRSNAPVDEGTGASTDGNGDMTVDLPNTTLAPGATMYVDVELASGNIGIDDLSVA